MHAQLLRSTVLGTLVLLAATGCTQQTPVDPDPEPVWFDAEPQTQVDGWVIDQEAYFNSRLMEFFACDGDPANPACQGGAPFMYLEHAHLRRALVAEATVSLIDPATGGAASGTSAPSSPYGAYSVREIETNPVNLYPLAEVSAATYLANPPPPHPALPPADPLPFPATTYLPTVNLRPVATANNGYCYVPRVGVVSTNGVLEAMVKLYGLFGVPMTVADFQDPTRFGGVVIWWFSQPLPWTMYQVPLGTEVHASIPANPTDPAAQPEVWQITWAPPGFGPPDVQSARGFMVNPADGNPDYLDGLAGLAVFLLPPTTQPFTEIEITGADLTPIPEEGRPWTWTPVRAKVLPGKIHTGFSMPDLNAERTVQSPLGPVYVPEPMSWRCLPPGADNQDL